MKPTELKKDLYWTGICDTELRVFDIIMETEFGTTYNSYLIKGSKKTALIETAKYKFFDSYVKKLESLTDLSKIDYIIVNHTEPDHAGSVEKLIELNPNIKIVGTAAALGFLKNIVNRDFYSIAVKENDVLSLGDKNLRFMILPNLHWPDTMYTYLEEEQVLFTCDSFGSHYSFDGILLSEVTDEEGYKSAAKYYFDNIIGPFKPYMRKALKRIEDLPVSMICTGHGPVIDCRVREIIGWRDEWSRETNPNTEKTVIIPYVSAYGYTKEMAMEEATRCLNCKHQPCKSGCPVGVPIPEFIHHVAEGEFEEAYQTITRENALPAICGRVCPQENQCEGKCVRGIKTESVGIGRLERFVADYHREHGKPAELKIEKNGKKVAVIGSGPAGITCAGELAKKGYDVTVFEALHKTGGVLSYGIPEFRLPKKLVQSEVDGVAALGVDFETNVVVGRSITIDELQEQGYQGIFVGSGAGLPRFQGIPGENLNGVYAANEFLTRVNLMKGYQFPDHPTPVKVTDTVCVIGAGNVAMDAARTAKRLGAKNVYIVYRRGPEEVPARAEEVHHAKEEGIIFKLLTNPVKIEGEDGWVKSMECVEMELGEPDASGRRRPIAKEGSNFTIETGTVIVAIGQSPNPLIRHTTPGLDCQSWGGIIVDEDSMKTSKDGVYAGGDVVTGAATVILAMGAGKKAAKAMDEYLQNK